ncbi:MAG: hypothetical protein QOJ15_8929, partial [Bradyrhizobium sp.]|nr:hypothetical protein [Bradyrhizobium sp.]
KLSERRAGESVLDQGPLRRTLEPRFDRIEAGL